MVQESRTRKTFLNARVNLIFYFLTLLLSFFSRKIFLDILGADFIGLTGTLQNLLSFLNLAEFGIGGAVSYVLYKPLFEQNQTKINEIISVFGYLYRWIGRIILIAGCILSIFLPWIYPNTRFNLSIIYLAYFSFLATSLIGYFVNYRQTLLSADQKNYVVTAYFQAGIILTTIIQMVAAFYTKNYYLWIVINLSFGIIYSFILNWKINQVYPWLKSDIKNGKILLKKYPEVIKLTKQVFVHKLGGIIQFQLTPFLVYAFVSLQTVAFYGNYTLITDKLKTLLANVLDSTSAGIGSLIAEGNTTKILKVYWELMSIRFLFCGIIVFSLYKLIPPFIELWLGKEYILSNNILILVLLIFALNIIRGTTDQFISAFGLFKDTWAPITEIVIFILAALIGGHFWKLEGLLFGSITSLLIIVYGWKPYFLFKQGFKISIWNYWLNFIKYILITAISFIILINLDLVIKFNLTYNEWEQFIKYAIFIGVSISIIHFLLLYYFSCGMKDVTNRFFIKKRRK